MFVFKFQKIQKLKEDLLKIEIGKLEEINRQIKQKKEEINSIHGEIQEYYKKFNEQIKAKLNFSQLKLLIANIEYLNNVKNLINTQIINLKEQENTQLTLIKNLYKEVKKYEKLQEHEKERYTYEEKLQESNFINDINAIFYNREHR